MTNLPFPPGVGCKKGSEESMVWFGCRGVEGMRGAHGVYLYGMVLWKHLEHVVTGRAA